jgi:hypothetical protein
VPFLEVTFQYDLIHTVAQVSITVRGYVADNLLGRVGGKRAIGFGHDRE